MKIGFWDALGGSNAAGRFLGNCSNYSNYYNYRNYHNP